jgi:serine phosphatase RsbU (regulator of sigma subunit)/anti-sigma regulatory factor (Ser/Thr protein kinase)
LKIHGRDIKLLAVDSDTVNLLLLEEALKDEGIEIDCCSVGDKALELVKKNHYDVVLLDIVMPDMDGFELRRRIRLHDQYLPIIYLTAIIDTAHNNLMEKISSDNATYYKKKPYSIKRLLEMIHKVVKAYRSEDETRKYYTTLEGNLDLASEVQHLLLPDWIRVEDEFIMSSLYRPVYKVSGDIFEAVRINPGQYFVLLGDIAGHGIQAALYMSAIQALVKTMVSSGDVHIDEVLNRLNRFFCVDMQKKNYMTCLVALFDFMRNKLQFISAGHLSFFMHEAKTGNIKLLNPENKGAIPVGWMKDYEFDCKTEAVEIDFDDDCSFFGITDGIVEISNSENIGLGVERFQNMLTESASKTIPALVPYHVCHSVSEAGYNKVEDDACMLMIRKNYFAEADADKHLFLTTLPDMEHADILGMECERMIIKNTSDERLAVEVELLLSEFLNNIIMHGLEKTHQHGPKILVDLQVKEGEVFLTIWDKGRPWKFNNAPVSIDENIWDENNKLATAGRGMAIMTSIADKIECHRYGDLNETSFVIEREG